VVVHFDLRGREWNDKYFTNLNAWKVHAPEGVEQATSSDVPDLNEADVPGQQVDSSATDTSDPSEEDDLPF
jgi:16S rRNA U1498 N3-methylase RsmE